MKRSLFFSMAAVALLLIASLQKLAAQNTAPYWSLAGNTNATNASFLGSRTAGVNLRLFAGNAERIHITGTTGFVGIGTLAPAYRLHVLNTAASQTTIYGQATGAGSYGVWGSGITRGVFGSSGTGYGVYGQGGAYGVYGTGTARGVWGNTATAAGYGVYGSNTSSSGTGVYGASYYGVRGSGTYGVIGSGTYGTYGSGSTVGAYGVGGTYGVVGSGSSYGVYGGGPVGVYGSTSSSTGIGVSGTGGSSATGTGVYGTGYYGVHGVGVSGTSGGVYGEGATWGVYGSGPIGTEGISTVSNSFGVYGLGFYGVYGLSNNNWVGVRGDGANTGIWGVGGTYGVFGQTGTSDYGVYGTTSTSFVSGHANKGVFGIGYYGVYGQGGFYGVYGLATEAVYGHSNGASGDAVLGYADAGGADYGGNFYSSTSHGVYGATGNTADYAGYFNGNVFTTGSYLPSDRQLKQNITDMTNAMDIINKLQPKYYEYRQDGNYKLMNLPQGRQFGLIAQDLEQVLPNLVKETEYTPVKYSTDKSINEGTATAPSYAVKIEKGKAESFKAINYTELIPILVKAMQELSKKTDEIDALKDRIKHLEDLVNKSTLIGDSYSLDAASLDQNTPNPFNSGTSIRYRLPQNIGSAKIVITDASGRTMKTMTLTSRGAGEISLNSGTLAAGTYNYTLWVDGKQVDSRKMIVAK